MGRARSFAVLVSMIALASCGGGGGSSGGGSTGTAPPPPPPPPPVSTLPVTMVSSENYPHTEGSVDSVVFIASYTGTPSSTVVPDVQIAGGRLELFGSPSTSGSNAYAVQLHEKNFPPGGKSANVVTFRLCTDASCSTVYPGSTQTITINMTVTLKDWGTTQRDAAHTGYVGVAYDASKFTPAWSIPRDGARQSGIAAREGTVFFNVQPTATAASHAITKAVASDTGAVRWTYDLGQVGFNFSAPSYGNGRVTSAAVEASSSSVPLRVLDATDGHVLWTFPYAGQAVRTGTPVFYGDRLIHAAGLPGNTAYEFHVADGYRVWQQMLDASDSVVKEGESVAVDSQYVYFYTGANLTTLNRNDGAVTVRFSDPFFVPGGQSYFAAPLLDGIERIVTFSGNHTQNQAGRLIAFAFSKTEPVWRTPIDYINQPALRTHRLYAPRANSTIVDILDVYSGDVLGTMNVGAGKPSLTSNVIVTESHVFVASDTETYVLDLNTAGYPVVWTAPHGGELAITPDNLLIVSGSEGVFAYKLN